MSVDVLPDRVTPAEPAFVYRAPSVSAVIAAGLGVLSVLAVFDWWLAIFPVAGVLLATHARREIRRRPDELTGNGLATAGLALSLGFWAVGWSWLGYVYATEVPEGYLRIGYGQLQPDRNAPDELVPPAAQELDGQKVFIKGYVYPTISQHGIREFLLVRDSGSCCFGGNPKITDRIQVRLAEGRTMSYTGYMRRLTGVFRINPAAQVYGTQNVPGGVIYQLEEAEVR
jgi:hypothetical protein